jgi:hypothetical protein
VRLDQASQQRQRLDVVEHARVDRQAERIDRERRHAG